MFSLVKGLDLTGRVKILFTLSDLPEILYPNRLTLGPLTYQISNKSELSTLEVQGQITHELALTMKSSTFILTTRWQ